MKRILCTLVLLSLPTLVAAQEKLPANAKVTKLEAQPAKIELKNPFAYAQLLLSAQLDNGDRIVVTRMATVEMSGAAVKISPLGQVRPAADGEAQLKCTVGGQTVLIPAVVSGQKD